MKAILFTSLFSFYFLASPIPDISGATATGNRSTGIVTVCFTLHNHTSQTMDLLISTNRYNLKAFDEYGKEYHASSVRTGTKENISCSPSIVGCLRAISRPAKFYSQASTRAQQC